MQYLFITLVLSGTLNSHLDFSYVYTIHFGYVYIHRNQSCFKLSLLHVIKLALLKITGIMIGYGKFNFKDILHSPLRGCSCA